MIGEISEPRIIAESLANVEGPVIGPAGWILNVCSITRPEETWWTLGGDVTATNLARPGETYRLFNTSGNDSTGIPASLAFGPDERLYITDEGRRAILATSPGGFPEEFITHWRGLRLNGPNDLSFDESGNLYFTDPWTSSPENPVGAVYVQERSSGEVYQVDNDMQFPNGIVIRGTRLYVAETYRRCVWLYDAASPRSVGNKRLFATLPSLPNNEIHGPDGMTLDEIGRLYVAHYGAGAVFVFDQDGNEELRLPTPGRRPTNVCFGGPRHDRLYVTVDDTGTLIEYDLGITGWRLPFCPATSGGHAWTDYLQAST